MSNVFVDTNILLYAVSTSAAGAAKSKLARNLLEAESWTWSAQVAAEFVRASRSPKQPAPLTLPQAREWIELWMAFPMVPIDGPLILDAIKIGERFQISHFDAQILAAANRAGCETVFSEDLNHNQLYGAVRVINPFLKS